MALGLCRECGEQVSIEAKVCPKCGVPKPVKRDGPSPAGLIFMIIGGALALFFIVAIEHGSHPIDQVKLEKCRREQSEIMARRTFFTSEQMGRAIADAVSKCEWEARN